MRALMSKLVDIYPLLPMFEQIELFHLFAVQIQSKWQWNWVFQSEQLYFIFLDFFLKLNQVHAHVLFVA